MPGTKENATIMEPFGTMRCPDSNQVVDAVCAGTDVPQCFIGSKYYDQAMQCVPQHDSVFASDKSSVEAGGASWATADCSKSEGGGIITGVCLGPGDGSCADGANTSLTCRPLVDNPWSEEPSWGNENMGGFWSGTWSGGPVGTYGPSAKTKDLQSSNLSMCKPGYVATALCNATHDRLECIGGDIAAAYKATGAGAWSAKPITFLKCGKLRQEQGDMISDMSKFMRAPYE